jgi:hypothetical protein
MIDIPAKQIPPFRYGLALKAGIKQILMTTWGGLGDQVCAEPTLRYAFKLFPEYEISLLTSFPELFSHLPFKHVFHNKSAEAKELNEDEWLVIHTMHPAYSLSENFLQHHFTQVVDFSSLCAFQRQLPTSERQIKMPDIQQNLAVPRARIVIHPGKTWASRTFPKAWWDEVIGSLARIYSDVVIIGKDGEATGTVDIEVPANCTDLRNKLTLPEMIQILVQADVVLTNDSAPIHIAAAGNAHIFFIASAKHSDYLMHWRHGEFGWRMRNLGLDGLWNHQAQHPVREEPLAFDTLPVGLMNRILPPPSAVLSWIEPAMNGRLP